MGISPPGLSAKGRRNGRASRNLSDWLPVLQRAFDDSQLGIDTSARLSLPIPSTDGTGPIAGAISPAVDDQNSKASRRGIDDKILQPGVAGRQRDLA